jgi:hypothetical protein
MELNQTSTHMSSKLDFGGFGLEIIFPNQKNVAKNLNQRFLYFLDQFLI